MSSSANIKLSFSAALPIMLGYLAIGIPCGILSSSIGLNVLQVILFSLLFYSGAGQFMIPNMWIAGAPLVSIIASVSLVNTRQMLYAASFAHFCRRAKKSLAFLFAATVTDESFGVNMSHFIKGTWSIGRATMVNLMSQSSWMVANVIGVIIGSALGIPLAIASFAMTSIFICLLVSQMVKPVNMFAAFVAALAVFFCKAVGIAGPAIVIGALVGVCGALVFDYFKRKARP